MRKLKFRSALLLLPVLVVFLNLVTVDVVGETIAFSDAEITYSPTEGPAGTVVTVSGTLNNKYQKAYEDAPNHIMAILWQANALATPELLGNTILTEALTFSTTITIPEGSAYNPNIVVRPPNGRDSLLPITNSLYPLPFNINPLTRIYGRVSIPDSDNQPEFFIPHARIHLSVSRPSSPSYVLKEDTITSPNGEFEFYVPVMDGDQGEIRLEFASEFGGENYFKIVDCAVDTSRPASVTRNFTVAESDVETEKKVDLVLTKTLSPQDYTSGSRLEMIHYIAQNYRYSHQAVKYAVEVLSADITKINGRDILPVTVKFDSWDMSGTSYNPTRAEINIDSRHSINRGNLKAPYPQFHEWGHHFMFTQFNIVSYMGAGTRNHNGYLNPDTSDSLSEGEANFFSVLMSRYYGYQSGEVLYDIFGVEANWPAWAMVGQTSMEETAVTALLWDLIDDTPNEKLEYNDFSQTGKKDGVSIPLRDLWGILKDSSTHNVFNLCTNLNNAFPAFGAGIDSLFIDHGFFADKQEGDGQYNGTRGSFCGEPLGKDPSTGASTFADLGSGHNSTYGQIYDQGETIGAATNYQRPNRKSTITLEGSCILIKDNEVDSCILKFEFEPEFSYYNFQFEQRVVDNLLYMTMPPSRYKTVATVIPVTAKEVEPLVFTSEDYFQLLDSSQDYFIEKEFGLDAWSLFPLSPVILAVIGGIIGVLVVITYIAIKKIRKKQPPAHTPPPPPPPPLHHQYRLCPFSGNV